MLYRVCVLWIAFAAPAAAQIATARTVQATGTATVSSNPDQAALDVGVVTNAATAQDSAAQNAVLTSAVINAVKTVLAGNGTIQTQYYSVTPRYAPNSAAIAGYTTNNTLHVISTDLSLIGKLIDAANGAGANSIGGISFGMQDSNPLTQQALAAAAKQALAHAAAIAAGLGGTLGAVINAQEGSSYTPVMVSGVAAGAAASTPVVTGAVTVSATVTLVAQLQ